MDRRKFVALVGSVLAAPRLVLAQPAKIHRVAWFSTAGKATSNLFLTPFIEGMAALGYVEGRNLVIDGRWGENSREALDRLALEAAALNPAVIVTQGPALHAARKLPGSTPVVFGFSGDPVLLGVAKSLARPGDRYTGVTFLAYDLVGKRVELLREMLPRIKRLAVLSNTNHVGDAQELSTTLEAAARYGMSVSVHRARNTTELESALAEIAAARAEAVVVHPDGMMVQQRETIARFSLQQRIPAVSGWAAIAEGGNLATYGPVLQECYRRLAYFTDRILRGANPADLPIELPPKFELVINLRTAKALGIRVPQSVLLRADRVIE
ncbi:MAG: ABC transporter substrate-binding protein [Pseudomonadota bacterium]